jgi:serine/threonine protein kinase/tetratricopeptide (TPR) repeat protein
MFFQRDHIRKGDEHYRKGNLHRAAELYLKGRSYRQAAKVYEELGEIDRAVQVYEDHGRSLKAAELLVAQDRHKDAIPRFEKAGAFRQAAEACLEIRNFVRAGRLFEQAEMFARAAECFLKKGEIEQGVRALERESQRLRQRRGDAAGGRNPLLDKEIRQVDLHRAEILSNIGRHLEAAKLLVEHGQINRAAVLYERGGELGEAARAYLAAGRVQEALKAVERAPDAEDELRAEIYLNCARHAEAARLFEKMGRYDAAASAYEGDEAWAEAAAMWEHAGTFGRAAEFYLKVGRLAAAGRCFAADQQPDKAAAAFRRAGRYRDAGDTYREAGELLRAGEQYLRAGDGDAAREAFREVAEDSPDFGPASLRLIPLLVEEGSVGGALQRWRMLKKKRIPVPSRERLYVQGRLVEARGRYQEAEVLYQKVLAEQHDFRDAAERLRDVRGRLNVPSEQVAGAAGGSASRASASRGSASASRASGSGRDPGRPDPSAAAADSAVDLPFASLAETSELPFDMGEELDPWWSGAAFFRATDRRNSRQVSLVSFPLAAVASRTESFRQAMQQVAAVRHPAVLRLVEAILASDKVLLLYQPFSGRTLGRVLAERRFTPREAVSLIAQLTEALTAAHKVGVTHQWISPRTILMDAGGRIRLVGLGLREILAEGDDVSRAYLSPEVLAGGMVGPASDVYSLGLLAIELLQAQMPADWSGREAVDEADVRWPEEVEKEVSKMIRGALVRALAREPLARPSTEELKAALSSLGLAPGQLLADRYEILGPLGTGGMSRVYRARDREFDDEVAIKTLLTPAIGHSDDEERLLHEVRICRKISHPNVVRVHDLGRFPGGIFVIMELLAGPGLDRVIQKEAPLELGQVKKLLSEIAAGLAEAHHLKIIHRDLKPSNVMLVDGRVKVLDFGIARMADGSTVNLTRTGEVVGSPKFMAPEQIQGRPLTGACDLYALGVIAFALLTGREPFLGETATAIVLKHLHEEPPDLGKLRPDLPAAWIELVNRLLAKKPEDRPRSAEELIAALDELPDSEEN